MHLIMLHKLPSVVRRIQYKRLQQTSFSVRRDLVTRENDRLVPLASTKSPWVEQKDPAGSSLTYFWNTKTNETTPLGALRPQHWVEVRENPDSDLTYWWNPETNQTTALGAPDPSKFQQSLQNVQYQPRFTVNQAPVTLWGSMKTYFILGIGLTLGMSAVRIILGG